MNINGSFRDIENGEITTKTFRDRRGFDFEVTYDALTGAVVEVSCSNPHCDLMTIIKKHEGNESLWLAKHVCPHPDHLLPDERHEGSASLPGLTRYLSDARYNAERGELTLASQKRTKRWVLRANRTSEFFGIEGHTRLQ